MLDQVPKSKVHDAAAKGLKTITKSSIIQDFSIWFTEIESQNLVYFQSLNLALMHVKEDAKLQHLEEIR